MNKKLLAEVSLAAIAAASFWACGDGNINQMSGEDEVMLRLYALDPATGGPSSELVTLKNDALTSCKEDPGCYVQYQAYLNGDEPVDVNPDPIDDPNQGQQNQNQNQNPSSSASRDPFVIVEKPSSSSMIVVDPGDPSSSSMEIVSDTTFGTCAPEKATISKGESVKWKFSPNSKFAGFDPVEVAKSIYAWTTTGGVDDGTQKSTSSGNITYAASGQFGASVVVSYKGANYPITCSPLQVNGFPITCTCAVDGGDITDDQGIATWTASCTSRANITGYTWDGTDLGATAETYQHLFEKKGDTYTPKLSVANDDNTVQVVECPAVKATDSSLPDYLFTLEDAIQIPSKADQSLNVKSEGCMSIRGKWNNSGYNPTIKVLCDMSATSSPVSFTMTYGTKTYTKPGESWGFSNAGGEIAPLSNGPISIDNICVTFTGAETVTCYLQ